jgi:hypothetical protein
MPGAAPAIQARIGVAATEQRESRGIQPPRIPTTKGDWQMNILKGILALIVILAFIAVRREWETGQEEMKR